MDALTALPETVSAGTTISYRRTLADFPASAGWDLTLYLAGRTAVNVTAAPDGDGFVITIPASQTSTLPAGDYAWVERVSKASERHDVGRGLVRVLDDPALASGDSQESWNEKTLRVVEAAIQGRLDKDLESYQIGSRQVVKIPVKELFEIRSALRAAVRAEQGGGRQTTLASFTKMGLDR